MARGRLLFGMFVLLAGLLALPSMASALNFQPGTGGTAAQVGSVSDIASGDFDSDGLDDLAAAGGTSPDTNGIDVLLADGGGDFTKSTTLDCGNASGCVSLAVGNFTGGDGNLDIFGFPYQSNSNVFSFIGNGTGGFSRLSMNTPVTPHDRNSIGVGDLNNNDLDDIVLGGSGGSYAIGIAQGPGTFSFTSGQISGAGNLTSANMGNFNGDSNVDVAFGDDAGHVYVLLGDGGGSLTQATGSPSSVAGGLNYVQSIVAADFNEDGRDDVGVSTGNSFQSHVSSVQTFISDATGSPVANPNSGGSVFSQTVNDEGPNTFSDLVTADFDKNGTAGDLAYLSVLRPNGPTVYQSSIHLSNGAGAFTAAPNSPFTYNQPTYMWGQAQGDFNGDGTPDLAGAAPGGGSCFGCAAPVLMSLADVSTDPGSVDFGDIEVGKTNGLTLTIKNGGAPTADLSGFTITNDAEGSFSINDANDCTATIEVPCDKVISFAPSSPGVKSATLNISNADGPNLAVALNGTGTEGQAEFSPNPADFGKVPVGTTSQAQTITVTSSGTAPLVVGAVAEEAGLDSGSFEIVGGSDTCSGQTIAVGNSCGFDVVMTPQLATGPKTLVINVPTNDPNPGDQSVTVTGEATNPGVTVTPTPYDFGEVDLNSSAQGRPFEIKSTGTTPLDVTGFSVSGVDADNFFVASTSSCLSADIQPDGSCTFFIVFDPDAGPALRTATVNVQTSAASSPTPISVSATVTVGNLTIAPSPVEFGEVRLGQASAVETITVSSDGTGPVGIIEVGLNGSDSDDYERVSNTCEGAVLPPGGTCEIGLKFTPSDVGERTAELKFETESGNFYVSARGTGINPAGSLNPPSQDFGSVTVGSSSAPKTITVSSTGPDPLKVTSASITGTDAGSFSLANVAACNGTQASTCDLSVTFSPTGSAGARSATLNLDTNAGTITSSLTGTATAVPVPPVMPKASLTLKADKKVKRGKKLTVTARIKGISAGAIAGIVVATKVSGPGKAPKSVKISSLGQGKTRTIKLKVPVRKSARPGKKLTVSVSVKTGGKKLATKKVTATVKK